ncbi:MAG: hypothetical protein FJ286_11775 [Planctomycetes bacterium]|nr:hypothetical protein [Planctomycetota bacterium]
MTAAHPRTAPGGEDLEALATRADGALAGVDLSRATVGSWERRFPRMTRVQRAPEPAVARTRGR